MNRCTPHLARRWRLGTPLALLALLTLSPNGLLAQTQPRPFPANALRGVLTVTQPPEVLMNGKADRLSPGSRIRAANNMMVLSATLAGKAMLVNYTREPTGAIHDVWILTEAEAALPPPGKR